MKEVICSFIHMLSAANKTHMIFAVVFLVIDIALIVLYPKWKNGDAKLKLWGYLCWLPFFISIIHFAIFGFGSAWKELLEGFIFLYAAAMLIAIWSFFKRNKKIFVPLTVIVNTVVVLSLFYFSITSPFSANYTNKDYEEAFVSLCDYMQKNYVLADWKKTDFEELKEKYLPAILEAERTNNKQLYIETLEQFVWDVHDGHVVLDLYEENADYVLPVVRNYHDYGFSLTKIDNGDVIAVDVEESITNEYGIENGTVITAWNGEEILTAIEQTVVPMSITVKENEDMLKPFFLSATGDETVAVTFIDGDNNVNEAIIPYLKKDGLRHLRSMGSLYNSYFATENFATQMLNDDTGYMRIALEITEPFYDDIAYITLNHKYAREMFREKLRVLRSQGMKKLVIDIRGNGGGYDEVSVALTELFADQEYFAYSNGVESGEKYRQMATSYVRPDGEFADIQVVVLTSCRCASAGDGLALYLSRLPNVTLAGITNPEGINQETGGSVFMPDGVVIRFPTGIVVNEDNEPNIDPSDNRISRNPVEVKIPYDEEAALQIYNRDGDYEIEWAIDYLNTNE